MFTRICSLLLFFVSGVLQAQPTDTAVNFSAVSSYKLLDARQQKTVALSLDKRPLSLFVFISPECPLCQGYTRSINALREKYKAQINVYGIVPGNAYTVKEVNDFEQTYNINFPLLIDTQQSLTRYLGATVTPQAIVLRNNGNLVYTGAIDDWVVSLGKKRLRVSEFYVQQAVEQSLSAGNVTIKKTNAIGCRINDY